LEKAKQNPEKAEVDPAVLLSVKVPMQEITGLTKTGKPTKRHEKVLPGYILVEMDLPEVGWKKTCSKIYRLQGVNGFVGTKPTERPNPISDSEARKIFQQTGEIKGERATLVQNSYDIGDKVKITEGPFATFSGAVEEILADKNKLRVNVQIFGRATPVEVDVGQVEKI